MIAYFLWVVGFFGSFDGGIFFTLIASLHEITRLIKARNSISFFKLAFFKDVNILPENQ
jgi:hypothetical protein